MSFPSLVLDRFQQNLFLGLILLLAVSIDRIRTVVMTRLSLGARE